MAIYPTAGISLCSGIAGLDLGVSRAVGEQYQTVAYVEGEAYAAAVLAARISEGRLPEAAIWSDVKTFDGKPWRKKVDLITAGYPCQPFSVAGRRKGEHDPRHLWPAIATIIRDVQPRWVFCENVPGHINLGLDKVCEDLEGMGYQIEAGLFSAEECGAPHIRQRLFILAYADSADLWHAEGFDRESGLSAKLGDDGTPQPVADANSEGQPQQEWVIQKEQRRLGDSCKKANVADADGARCPKGQCCAGGEVRNKTRRQESKRRSADVADADGDRCKVGHSIQPSSTHATLTCSGAKCLVAICKYDTKTTCTQLHRMVNGNFPRLDIAVRKHDASKISQPQEDMLGLRKMHDAQTLYNGTVRRPEGIFKEKVLRSNVYGSCFCKDGTCYAFCIPLEGTASIIEGCLRKVSHDDRAGNSSQKQRLVGQCRKQPGDSLQSMPHETSSPYRRHGNTQTKGEMCALRQACLQAGFLLHPSQPLEEAWRSMSGEETQWAKEAAIRGIWHSEIPGVERTTSEQEHRVDRLRCIGNAVVPATAELAFRTLFAKHERNEQLGG